MMPGHLEGKTAVVTGAGRGIGRGIALLLAEEGANVVVNDPGVDLDGSGEDSAPARQVVAEIKENGGNAVASFESVATVAGGESIIKEALDSFGRIDILVNVAGILRDRMIFNMSEQEWDDVIAVHLKGHYNTIKPASILMRQQRYGRIINFSSSSGLIGNAGQANYGAAKAGIAGLTRVVARDLGRYGVTCNAIAPGAATRMTASVPGSARQARSAAGIAGAGTSAATTSAPSANAPEMVAPMVCYLCTDDAWNINGQIFSVSGGRIGVLNHPVAARSIFKRGLWTLDELDAILPDALPGAFDNPAPPAGDVTVAGRAKMQSA
jgi:NAD(P)-dependent dehydrogenase (short-subunit alcohol dehydrogenase family)